MNAGQEAFREALEHAGHTDAASSLELVAVGGAIRLSGNAWSETAKADALAIAAYLHPGARIEDDMEVAAALSVDGWSEEDLFFSQPGQPKG